MKTLYENKEAFVRAMASRYFHTEYEDAGSLYTIYRCDACGVEAEQDITNHAKNCDAWHAIKQHMRGSGLWPRPKKNS